MADDRVGKKIKKLIREGKPQKQSVAIALSMNRAGRLGKEGGYKRVRKKQPRSNDSISWLHG